MLAKNNTRAAVSSNAAPDVKTSKDDGADDAEDPESPRDHSPA